MFAHVECVDRRFNRVLVLLGGLTVAAALLAGALVASARAAGEMQITSFSAGLSDYQAGGHPDAQVSFRLATEPATIPGPGELGEPVVTGGSAKDIVAELPKGLFANPKTIAQCTAPELTSRSGCPDAAEVGMNQTYLLVGGAKAGPFPYPVYNMVPERGEIAKLGFRVSGSTNVFIGIKLDPSRGYRILSTVANVFSGLPVWGSDLTIWGVPSAPIHDPERVCSDHQGGQFVGCAASTPPSPFMVAPSQCGVDGNVAFKVRSYRHPGDDDWATAESEPRQVFGCDRLTFEPSATARPTSTEADSPTGLGVKLDFPQHFDNPTGLESPQLRDAVVTLPEGLTINPASADGLQACDDAALGLGSEAAPTCPSGSRIGTVEAETPVLSERLTGGVFLRPQASGDPESGEMFRIALVLANPERGLMIKLPGQVRVNAATGQVQASFKENPQLPVSEVKADLKSGPRSPLATPAACGTKATAFDLSAWSGQESHLSDSFDEPCPGGDGFSPKLSAGTENPLAASTSPFSLRLTREDGEQALSGLRMNLPPGLTAYLKGVPYCPESAIAAAAGKSGREEQSSPSCPAASRVGTVEAGAGAGNPYYVGGEAYLAGPYEGAPLSLAVITPAVAGPFDLGTVVVRAALQVDPMTAQVTAVSDPLPRILKGVPLRLRDVRVRLDRPGFTLNPSSCDPTKIESAITSSQGAMATISSRFQVADCERLAFKPALKIQLRGATGRLGHPALKAVLTPKPGEANIGRAQVNLPHGEFLDQGNLNKTCTRPVLMAGQCPKSTVYGTARAWTPLLDRPLEGNVYLVGGYGYKLPALVADLDGQIRVLLVGKVDSGQNKGIRNTFEMVPDAPVSRFVLQMKGGRKYGLLENEADLCTTPKGRRRAIVRFTGQNGKVDAYKPVVQAQCGKKHKKQAKKKGGHGH